MTPRVVRNVLSAFVVLGSSAAAWVWQRRHL